MPPPSSGGIVVSEALGILSQRIPDPLAAGRGSSGYLHLLA
jgi:gamma-glutamyltranspeptidase